MDKRQSFDYPNPQMGLVLQHFYEHHPEVVDRAGHEFFEYVHAMQERVQQEKIEALFNEWFIYDFHLKTDKTPLETYIYRNPDNLDEYELDLMEQVLEKNFTGYFWVDKVEPEKQLMTLVQLETGKFYKILDATASQIVESNSGVVAIRLVNINGQWYFASDPVYFMPITPIRTEIEDDDGEIETGQNFIDVVKSHYGFVGEIPLEEDRTNN